MTADPDAPRSRQRQVVQVLISHALASVAMSLPWPLLLLEAHDRFGDGWELGGVGAARLLPYAVLSWIAGGLADRWGRGRVVRASLILRMALLAVTGFALAGGALGFAVVAATACVAAATPAYPALAASMPALAGRTGGRSTSTLVTIEVTSFVVGPALGGLAIPLGASAIGVFAVTATGLAAAIQWPVQLPSPPTRTLGAAPPASLAERLPVLGLLRRPGPVRTAFTVMALINAVLAAVGIALLPLAHDVWSRSPQAYGTAMAVLGFGALAGPILRGVGRADTARMARTLGLLGLCLLVVAVSPSAAWALPPLALAGAAAVQSESAATGLIQATVPDQHRAGTLGAADTVMVLAAMVAALVTPILASGIGVIPLVMMIGTGTALGAALLRSRRCNPAPYVPQSG